MKCIRGLFVVMSLCLAFVIGTQASHGGEKKISRKQIPAAVLKTFESAYPNAKIKGQSVETEKGVKYYEIESTEGTMNRDLLYTADGKVTEIEESMDLKALPADMKSALEKKYPKGKILKVEKVTLDTAVAYEAHVKVGKKTVEVKFNGAMKVIKAGKNDEEKGENESENEDEDD